MKKKIIFVTSVLTGGGAVRVLLNIINSLSLEKYELILFVMCAHSNENVFIKEGVNVVYFSKNRLLTSIIPIMKQVLKIKPDYLFSTDYFGYVLPFFKLFCKTKVISRVNVPPSEFPLNTLKVRISRFIQKQAYKFTDIIIAQTEFSKKDIVKWFKTPNDKIKVIRNIIDNKLLDTRSVESTTPELSNNKYNIVAAGALYSVKGFDLLIESMIDVVRHIPNASLTILGKERYEADYGKFLMALIKRNKLEEYVCLAGHKNNPYPYLKNADLFVLSSRTEAFPNVVLESLYLGTPVVATNVVDFGGVISNGTNGYVVNKGSVQALADGIVTAQKKLRKPINFRFSNFDYSKLFA